MSKLHNTWHFLKQILNYETDFKNKVKNINALQTLLCSE